MQNHEVNANRVIQIYVVHQNLGIWAVWILKIYYLGKTWNLVKNVLIRLYRADYKTKTIQHMLKIVSAFISNLQMLSSEPIWTHLLAFHFSIWPYWTYYGVDPEMTLSPRCTVQVVLKKISHSGLCIIVWYVFYINFWS